ncbi:hypothetical protein DVH24_029937 [Malus domestica]|uniref:Protein kinase domain-containing protein n=1 Tax=Malus domestica TaxID=3750 RepID=A0A498HUT2_MALDO|nr:hypothetical protein DVH24_029937 [Malus domestica]
MDMGFAGLAAAAANVGFGEAEDGFGSSASRARAAFQWGGTVFALILLILNRAGRRSAMQSNFLVLYLFTSFPTVLFKILRGQFGYWVSFLAVAANLFFPQTVPVSRFLLFVVTPVWVANGLRDSIVGCIFCLILGVSLRYEESEVFVTVNQPYEGQTFTDCYNPKTYSKSVLGYTCNGASKSCETFLTFRSRAPYNMVFAISNMLTSDVSQLAEINLVSEKQRSKPTSEYYQINTSHVVVKVYTFLIVANNTLPGLSTCQAMLNQNSNLTAENLYIGDRLIVALRCACPTKNQTDLGFNSQTVEPPTSSPSPPAIPPPPSNNSNKTWVYTLFGALGGGGLVLVIGHIIFCTFFRGSTKKGFDPIIASESFEPLEKPQGKKVEEEVSGLFRGLSGIAQSLQVYKFEDLQRATGSVYRAKINEDLAAIKKMNGDVSKEINLLKKVSHSNLIRLSGVCFNDGHSYLIYEYAVNGPLSDWIYYSSNHGKFLNWTQKIQILLDVASGLHYLHSFTTPPHVHKDVKSSNILLDSDFRAKIADFSLARSTEAPEGYIAPEYLENGLISTKLDVYAFGARRLEVLTGKDIAMFYKKNICLSDVVYSLLNNEDGGQSLKDYPPKLSLFVIKLIDNCLKRNPAARPRMEEMVQFMSRNMSNSLGNCQATSQAIKL